MAIGLLYSILNFRISFDRKGRRMHFGIDAGGTSTSVLVEIDGTQLARRFGSLSASSVGEAVSVATMEEIFRWLVSRSLDRHALGWVGSAAVCVATLDFETRNLVDAAKIVGFRGAMVVNDDAAPLLLGAPLNGTGFVLIAGTGSIVLGRDYAGNFVQCGGYEWVLTDDGSGFHVGQQGLRAAAKAFDELGPDTALLDLARKKYQADIPEIGDLVARLPHPKEHVAAFAETVCKAADDGDLVSLEIIKSATADLVAMLNAAVKRLPNYAPRTVVTGSLPACSASYASALRSNLAESGLSMDLTILPNASTCALDLASRLTPHGRLPFDIGAVPHRIVQLLD